MLCSLRNLRLLLACMALSPLLNAASVTAQEERSGAEVAEEKEAEEAKPIDRAEFNRLYRAGKFDELQERVDAALADDPENGQIISLNVTLAMAMSRSSEEEALERLKAQIDGLMSMDALKGLNESNLGRAVQVYVMRDQVNLDDRLSLLEAALGKLSEDGQFALKLSSTKAQVLMDADRPAEAMELMKSSLAIAKQGLVDQEVATARNYLNVVNAYGRVLTSEYPEEMESEIAALDKYLHDQLDQDEPNAQYFQLVVSANQGRIGMLASSDPEQAEKMLEDLNAELKELEDSLDDNNAKAQLQLPKRTLASLESRIMSAIKLAKLVGSEAPEIDAVEFVAMEPVTMADLKGKVVLLDFWAVWCGPCIATFPHLIEWHEEYGDKGLVIMGATKFYGYEWDDESERASRGKDVSSEAELEMLAAFREHHKLQHGFFVTPDGSDYWSEFGVRGIPQAVLIDQEGKVAMVKVGSGPANAEALHEKIEELLGEVSE